MQKTIMIIGGGIQQLPVIQTARKMGLQVIVTDYNRDAIGMKEADVPIVMSTKDLEGSVRVAKKQNDVTPISAVLTIGTDASMTVSAVASALGLPGIKFDSAEAATNKVKMRNRFKEHNVPVPDFFPVWSLSDAKKACKGLKFPMVIKPADNMAARGVMRIDNINELPDAFNYAKAASPSGDLIIEEFMDGPELSIDAIIYDNTITFTGIADRIIDVPPYFIELGHNMPSSMPQKIQEEACEIMKRGIEALGISIGAAKGDIKITKKGAMIGELACRLSSGFMSTYTYPLSTGVDLMRAVIEVAMGQEPGNLVPVKKRVSIERAVLTREGTVKGITGLEKALKVKGIEEIFINVKPGDLLEDPRSNADKSANIIATGDTLKEAEESIRECLGHLKIDIDDRPEITMDSIRLSAREKFKKACYACLDCDGRNCASGVPGMGGTGSGETFKQNIESLKRYKIITRVVHNVSDPDTSTNFLGQNMELPVMPAPITGSVTNMAGAIDEYEYNKAVVRGAIDAGVIAFVGDGATPDKYKIGLRAVKDEDGNGIPIFKPRFDNKEIIMRIKAAEDAGVPALGIDIDAVVFKTMAMKNQAVGPKGFDSLKELIGSTELPFILKGIMNPYDAEMAVKAGASAIIVSNHGGRVLDQMSGTMDVLEGIVRAVKGDIVVAVDGGFRTGGDVLKAIAIGAEAVLIGRPVAIAAVGMGERGTAFYLNHIKSELKKAMVLTGCENVSGINKDVIREFFQDNE